MSSSPTPPPFRQRVNNQSHYRPNSGQHRAAPITRRPQEWRDWQEATVKVMQLPRKVTTKEIWRMFYSEGNIVKIEILDRGSFADSAAFVTFCPPPEAAFWLGDQGRNVRRDPTTGDSYILKMELRARNRWFLHPSPVNPKQHFPERTMLEPNCLQFGFMYSEASLMVMRSVDPNIGAVSFMLDLLRREIVIAFPLKIPIPKTEYLPVRQFRFRIPLAQLQRVYSVETGTGNRALTIPLETPPCFFRKVLDVSSTHDDGAHYWAEQHAWYRQTDITEKPTDLERAPITLKKSDTLIDIGRWTVYRLVFDGQERNGKAKYDVMMRALSDYNVAVITDTDVKLLNKEESAIWSIIDQSADRKATALSALESLENDAAHLDFTVRYQLEACLSHGYLNEHNISGEFIHRLAATETVRARNLLERVMDDKIRYYDPLKIFNVSITRGSEYRVIPKYCAWARSATVTPSMVYYANPTVETSNRIIRQFADQGDRFLRVKFTDEKSRGRLNSQDDQSHDEVFTRVKRALQNGITIGDRHFEFLAFGNAQFREHGAYFFASTPSLTAAHIRAWMGEFDHINVIAKYAARLGQCFSTTRAIHSTKVTIREIEDVERNDFVFTDGVGKISPFLARLIAWEFGLPSGDGEYPSLFQFRLGGCKGVLAVWPDVREREIHIRKSQFKFKAEHQGLEIIRTSAFATATLNRQIIIVLSTLGVSDEAFLRKQQEMLSNLQDAMTDETVALGLLQRNIDANQMTLTVASMILDGFMESGDPFLMSILQLWRAWNIKYLKEKARIYIEKGAFVLGCTDETQTLKGHFETDELSPENQSLEDKIKALPKIFLQVTNPDRKGTYTVIEGLCILGRNPALHPGDIRVVRAVDNPALRHMKDVVVLPQTGDRDLANMCAGGDLDGDDYFVMWDPDLLPQEWNHEAMNYQAPKPLLVKDTVSIDDITSFFVTYMKNDRLGTIAHAHLAQADYNEHGVKDEKCLELAMLHSMAVDFPKTGQAAIMERQLRPRRWPHFMEKTHKPKEQIYQSQKVLGQLYDQVERVNFVPEYTSPSDTRVLDAYELDDALLATAIEVKQAYDAAVRRVMAQYSINTEFEVWTTFVLSHNQGTRDYNFAEELGRVALSLKQRFQRLCCEKLGLDYDNPLGHDFSVLGPFVAAMYVVTTREMTAALNECGQTKKVGGKDVPRRPMDAKHMPLMSFPWLFPSELGRIASGRLDGRHGMLRVQQGVRQKRTKGKGTALPAFFDPEGGKDELITEKGVRQIGDLLDLFADEPETSPQVDQHAYMVERGIRGPAREKRPRRLTDLLPPIVVHKDWAPKEEVLEMIRASSGSEADEESGADDGEDEGNLTPVAGEQSFPRAVAESHRAIHDAVAAPVAEVENDQDSDEGIVETVRDPAISQQAARFTDRRLTPTDRLPMLESEVQRFLNNKEVEHHHGTAEPEKACKKTESSMGKHRADMVEKQMKKGDEKSETEYSGGGEDIKIETAPSMGNIWEKLNILGSGRRA